MKSGEGRFRANESQERAPQRRGRNALGRSISLVCQPPAESRAWCRGNKVTERERGVPSYVSKPRSNVEGAEGQGRIKGEDWVEERMSGPGLRHGASHRNALASSISLVY